MKRPFGVRSKSAGLALSALLVPFGATIVHAQNLSPAASSARNLDRGRELMDANDARAVDAYRAAAQDAINAVAEAASARAGTPPVNAARERAAEAHVLWGAAADHFFRRDEAIAAYARAISLALGSQPDVGGIVAPRAARDARAAISNLLRTGLPHNAPEDVLETIARNVQGGLWAPRRFTFPLPLATAAPGSTPASAVELLITDGKLFPPENVAAPAGTSRLARVAPLYRTVAPDALPAALKMDRALYGYARETSGPNRGLWRQVARVFYASDYLTRDNRDDRPRATVLCEQFLRTWALSRGALGLENPHVADGVTSLWLIEVSSWWPADDDDPIIAAQLPPRMPTPNTPLLPGEKLIPPIASSPLTRPWRASAQMDSAPGEILFFKAGYGRTEAEWLRQLTHEYGHVTLPQFDGFAPPLEPLGNGALGETLAALWISSAIPDWTPSASSLAALKGTNRKATFSDDVSSSAPGYIEFDRAAFASALDRHAAVNALVAFEAWKNSGPASASARDTGREGLRYLCGSALYIERVYGAPVLGTVFRTLNAQRKRAPRAADLLSTFASAHSSSPSSPFWLGGALDIEVKSVAALRERKPTPLKAGQTASAWLYVPAGVRGLRVFYTAARNTRPMPNIKNGVVRAEAGGGFSSLIPVGNNRGWTKFSFQAHPAAGTLDVGLAQWEK